MAGRVLVICNQKGGVGKTTSAVNLGWGLSRGGVRVLVMDLDSQANATAGLGVSREGLGAYALAVGENAEREIVRAGEGLEVLPGGTLMGRVGWGEEERIGAAIGRLSRSRDFVIADCPPSVSAVMMGALRAAGEVVVPVECEYYAMEGVAKMLGLVESVRNDARVHLAATMFKDEVELHREVLEELRGHLGELLLDTVVPWDAALAEAPSHGESVFDYAPRSRGAYAYAMLTKEVRSRG